MTLTEYLSQLSFLLVFQILILFLLNYILVFDWMAKYKVKLCSLPIYFSQLLPHSCYLKRFLHNFLRTQYFMPKTTGNTKHLSNSFLL